MELVKVTLEDVYKSVVELTVERLKILIEDLENEHIQTTIRQSDLHRENKLQ